MVNVNLNPFYVEDESINFRSNLSEAGYAFTSNPGELMVHLSYLSEQRQSNADFDHAYQMRTSFNPMLDDLRTEDELDVIKEELKDDSAMKGLNDSSEV